MRIGKCYTSRPRAYARAGSASWIALRSCGGFHPSAEPRWSQFCGPSASLAASRRRPASTSDGRRPLLGMSSDELRAWMAEIGQPAYRGGQIARWLYSRGAREFSEMTDLPAALRQRLDTRAVTGRARTAGK